MTSQTESDKPEESNGLLNWIVIAFIVAGLGVLLYILAWSHPYHPAPIARTRELINRLEMGLMSYYNDFNFYPIGGVEKDEGNINITLAVTDVSPWRSYKNGSPWRYCELSEDLLKPSGFDPVCKVIVDYWGNPFRYRSAEDSNGNIKPGIHNRESYDLWSCGPNRKDENGEGDDITNWDD